MPLCSGLSHPMLMRDPALFEPSGSTGLSVDVLLSPFERAAGAVRAQRDGCTLLRPRWGAGRMMHPPGRLLYIGKLRFLLPRRVTRYRHCHAPPSSNSVSEGNMRNLAASQFEPAVASRRSQRVPSIKPREVVAWASRTRCRVTVRRLCTARTVASAAKRHFLTFLDFYGDLQAPSSAPCAGAHGAQSDQLRLT